MGMKEEKFEKERKDEFNWEILSLNLKYLWNVLREISRRQYDV